MLQERQECQEAGSGAAGERAAWQAANAEAEALRREVRDVGQRAQRYERQLGELQRELEGTREQVAEQAARMARETQEMAERRANDQRLDRVSRGCLAWPAMHMDERRG